MKGRLPILSIGCHTLILLHSLLSCHTGLSVVGQLAKKGTSGASTADSAIGTSTRQSVITGGTFVGGSQFSEVRHQLANILCYTGWSATWI